MERDKKLTIRVSRNELAILKKKAQSAGMVTARYIRETALNKEIKMLFAKRFSEDEKELLKQLSRLGNILNQAVKKMHSENEKKDVLKTIQLIQENLKQLLR